ncbi:hook-length control protein FliK [Andreprevotia lacus DSM 23236]|jgi:flagellar hook-length control protein FliK|uniref:Hook-length control protein FliK n=1 Tax=Andreprevotia lacus DSM 23236 TaxID=1121001 RepID=A0A1W1XQN7_9NEIS|nr:flagellar hook-length control protein FliK [Andreprevotia lacus]SMC26172.1 hook-length control protein FliK [Andreprevotia lacus DSM 23236]
MTSAVNFIAKLPNASSQSTSKAGDQGGEGGFDQALNKEMTPKPAAGQGSTPTTAQPATQPATPQDTGPDTTAVQTQVVDPQAAAQAWLAMLQSMQQAVAQPQLPQTQVKGSEVQALAGNLLINGKGSKDSKDAKLGDVLLGAGKDGKGAKASDLLAAAGDGKEQKAEDIAGLGKSLPQLDDDKGQDTAGDFSRQLSQHLTAAQNKPRTDDAAATAKVPTHTVQPQVGSDRWGDAVAQRVSLMLSKQEQHIEMQLNPPHLGPMEVKLSMAADQASVTFTSQHANVREALAAATPKLTALLADQGITLANVQVASDSLNQQAQQQASQFSQFNQQPDGREQRQPGYAQAGNAGLDRGALTTSNLGEIRVPVARSGLNLYV